MTASLFKKLISFVHKYSPVLNAGGNTKLSYHAGGPS